MYNVDLSNNLEYPGKLLAMLLLDRKTQVLLCFFMFNVNLWSFFSNTYCQCQISGSGSSANKSKCMFTDVLGNKVCPRSPDKNGYYNYAKVPLLSGILTVHVGELTGFKDLGYFYIKN